MGTRPTLRRIFFLVCLSQNLFLDLLPNYQSEKQSELITVKVWNGRIRSANNAHEKKNRKKIEAKDQNAKIEKSPKKRDAENPRMRCWLTVCARSRVLHRLSQIVYSNNISAANQKTDFGAKGVHFFPKKSPPTGSSTLK